MPNKEKKIKVLAILGSPRIKGNSETLLNYLLKPLKNKFVVEKIILNNLKFRPCIECGGCDLTGVCILRDDLREVYKKLGESDIIIVASPIFFGSLTAQTKMLIDRMQCLWVKKYILKNKKRAATKKLGIFIAVGGAKTKKYFFNAKEIIKIFFRVLDIKYAKDLFCEGFDKKGSVLKSASAKNKATKLGKYLFKKFYP